MGNRTPPHSTLRLAISISLALGAFSPRPGLCETEREKAAARAFVEGKRLFDARKYIDAIATFEEAYRLRPHFMVQCSIARCYEHLSNVIQAAEHYRRCLQEGADKTKMVDRLRSSLQEVEARITWVDVSSPGGGGTIYVDGTPAGSTPKRVAINPGKHVIEVRRDGARPARQSINTLGGENLSFVLTPIPIKIQRVVEVPRAERTQRPAATLKQEPSRRRLSQVWFWSATGATAALAVVSIVLGVQTLDARSDYESVPTEEGYNSFVDKRLATNICWALTAAAAGGTTVLFFYTDFGGRRNEDEQGKRSSSFSIGLQGTF